MLPGLDDNKTALRRTFANSRRSGSSREEPMGTINVTDTGAVRTIVIDRAERRNALDYATVLALRDAFNDARDQSSIRALVLAGGEGIFSAGADVKEWAQEKVDGPDHDWVAAAMEMMEAIYSFPKPTIAMIDGAAAGAGVDIALCCDFRFASERARFICSYTRVGYPPDAGSSWLLPRTIGLENAKRFVFTGDAWDAPTALANRLITELHPVGNLHQAVTDFAARLASGPTVALGLAKTLLNESASRTFSEQLKAEKAAGLICAETADHHEGLAAANERRSPVFQGR